MSIPGSEYDGSLAQRPCGHVLPCKCPVESPREVRIGFLERKRVGTKADLFLKFEDEDWHGVADASMDLRDIDSELAGLRFKGDGT